MFDMICGTSTGGIIASFFAFKRMTVHACRLRYLTFAKRVFSLGRQVTRVCVQYGVLIVLCS
jgi:predicted acylesterase/phospholipase RssA